jgi:hypothetical protein
LIDNREGLVDIPASRREAEQRLMEIEQEFARIVRLFPELRTLGRAVAANRFRSSAQTARRAQAGTLGERRTRRES